MPDLLVAVAIALAVGGAVLSVWEFLKQRQEERASGGIDARSSSDLDATGKLGRDLPRRQKHQERGGGQGADLGFRYPELPDVLTAPTSPQIPQEFAGYAVVEVKSQRNDRSVLYVVDESGEPAIVKFVALGGPSELQALRLLFNEVQFLTHLRGRGAPRIIHTGTDSRTGAPFLLREFVPGRTLTEYLQNWPAEHVPTNLDILEFIKGLSGTVSSLHLLGFAHRDLHPSNIVGRWASSSSSPRLRPLDPPKLIDFEHAADIGDLGPEAGLLGGAPGFMAPEAYWSRRIGPEADSYAIGAIGLYLLTGSTSMADNESFLKLPASVQQLVRGALAMDPGLRMSVDVWSRAIDRLETQAEGWLRARPSSSWTAMIEQAQRSPHGLFRVRGAANVMSLGPATWNDALPSIVMKYYSSQGKEERDLIDHVLRRPGGDESVRQSSLSAPRRDAQLRRLHERLEAIVYQELLAPREGEKRQKVSSLQ